MSHNRDAMPYITLKEVPRGNHFRAPKVVMEVCVGTTFKEFPVTENGAKRVAKLLVKCKAESLLHSSSLDHYDDYGIKINLLEIINAEWDKLRPVPVIGWWGVHGHQRV